MSLVASFSKRVFTFNFKARTSRGLMQNKVSWFIKIWDDRNPEIFGIGECGPLPGLSVDDRKDFEEVLAQALTRINQLEPKTEVEKLNVQSIISCEFPSIIFGIETALLDLANGGKRIIFDSSFSKGQPIPINGLIWMGDMDFMMNQISKKIGEGFTCIKLKVGGLDFDRECDVLEYIRRRFFRENITIRLDANGAFKIDDVLFRLEQLSKFNIESIEQPIKPGLEEMEELCRKSSIPIAFDEELIGIHFTKEKQQLLDRLKPKYIVLKPSLHGGLSGCKEWIAIAESQGIGWWITSALESNIGLNAICQFTAAYPINMPQGLGTGAIYDNNISSPLKVERGNIFYDFDQPWSSEFSDC
jgi:O-succinylbenzoate synthase